MSVRNCICVPPFWFRLIYSSIQAASVWATMALFTHRASKNKKNINKISRLADASLHKLHFIFHEEELSLCRRAHHHNKNGTSQTSVRMFSIWVTNQSRKGQSLSPPSQQNRLRTPRCSPACLASIVQSCLPVTNQTRGVSFTPVYPVGLQSGWRKNCQPGRQRRRVSGSSNPCNLGIRSNLW